VVEADVLVGPDEHLFQEMPEHRKSRECRDAIVKAIPLPACHSHGQPPARGSAILSRTYRRRRGRSGLNAKPLGLARTSRDVTRASEWSKIAAEKPTWSTPIARSARVLYACWPTGTMESSRSTGATKDDNSEAYESGQCRRSQGKMVELS